MFHFGVSIFCCVIFLGGEREVGGWGMAAAGRSNLASYIFIRMQKVEKENHDTPMAYYLQEGCIFKSTFKCFISSLDSTTNQAKNKIYESVEDMSHSKHHIWYFVDLYNKHNFVNNPQEHNGQNHVQYTFFVF